MTEYSRDQFSNYSNDQLLDYIEQQNDQLNRFETRFRDVVRAYKGVLKEKEALESTVQALSAATSVRDEASDGVTEDQTRSGSECPTDNETDSDAVRGDLGDASDSGAEGKHGDRLATLTKYHLSPSAGSPGNQLRQQLSTLTVAMATLTEEKSKMESSFQKDKKAMLVQYDSLSKMLNSERETAKNESGQLQQHLEEVRESLRCEKRSRQDEQETHAQMLRELQALIATERDHKQALTLQLEEAVEELSEVRKQLSEDRVYEYEQLVQSMSVELEQVKGQLVVAERQDPSPELTKLQREMSALKVKHEDCLRKEQARVNEAEERLKRQTQHEEQRVASLEAKLSSLSETIGGYDRLRENDQATIQKLKERVVQLDSENTALTKEHVDREESTSSELTTQLSALQEKIARMKALLKLATVKINEKAVLPTNVEELSVSDYADILSSQPSGKEYQQELSQLKDEFERYKTRAQSVLRSRGGGKDLESVNRELLEVQRVNGQLHAEMDSLKEQTEEESEKHSLQLQKLRQEMRDMDTKHRREYSETETQYKNKLYELQTHVQTTRSRTFKLMDEKDSDIQKLKAELQSMRGCGNVYSGSPLVTRRERMHASQGSVTSLVDDENGSLSEEASDSRTSLNLSVRSADSSTVVQELLDKSSPVSSLNNVMGEKRLLHVVQEQKHRDSELAIARRKRLEVEDTNRDLEEREHRHMEQINMLKGEIRKLERDRSRETESMEYLKNVIMHYMCADSTGRDQMISPIATVLHFSPEEISQVKKRIAARRWLSAPPK